MIETENDRTYYSLRLSGPCMSPLLYILLIIKIYTGILLLLLYISTVV